MTRGRDALLHAGLGVFALLVLFPFVWIALAAFKTQIALMVGEVAFTPTLANFRELLFSSTSDYLANFRNSLVIGTGSTMLVLVVSTVIPSIDVTKLVLVLAAVMAVALVAGGAWLWWGQRHAVRQPEMPRAERENWRMPGLALLERPTWSPVRRVAMLILSGYLVLAIILLAVKATQLALGHH